MTLVNFESRFAFARLVALRLQSDILTRNMVVTRGMVGSYFLTGTVLVGRGDQGWATRSLLVH